jgi:prophage regulatory protein
VVIKIIPTYLYKSPFERKYLVGRTSRYEVNMSQSFIRLSEVQRRTGYSKAWIYRLMSQQRFPAAVKIGSRSIAFVESEIDEWINQRIAESRGGVA